MPLDPEKIKQLLEKKNKPKARSIGARGKKVDPTDRSYQAWFAYEIRLINDKEPVFCENPDCIDPREKNYGQPVVVVNGKNMCRFCFIEGWLLENANQQKIAV
jgi:hypothetical protein